MKTAKEIINRNKYRLNLPLHMLIGWTVWLGLSGIGWGLYGGYFLVWMIDLWLAKELIISVLCFVWGCLVAILSMAVVIGIIVWLLTI
ncbi:hypothetical protein [Bacteroides helcogenes]|nr:hypothetical protein [Bacteroides helcogenes]MDY5237405.1 hypothetical protein [Bacteroides helcogenes]